MVYLPEPAFGLVLAYHMDDQPARRALARACPGLPYAVYRDWGRTVKMVDIMAYILGTGPAQLNHPLSLEQDRGYSRIAFIDEEGMQGSASNHISDAFAWLRPAWMQRAGKHSPWGLDYPVYANLVNVSFLTPGRWCTLVGEDRSSFGAVFITKEVAFRDPGYHVYNVRLTDIPRGRLFIV